MSYLALSPPLGKKALKTITRFPFIIVNIDSIYQVEDWKVLKINESSRGAFLINVNCCQSMFEMNDLVLLLDNEKWENGISFHFEIRKCQKFKLLLRQTVSVASKSYQLAF